MNNNCNSLVSIVVVTYNASKYVLEALESVKNQTYKCLELIITDDCSTDNTVQICLKWLEINSSRFSNVQLLVSKQNNGITVNRNRGFFSAHGTWIKHIDGDDRLQPNCVEHYIDYISNNPSKNIIFSPLSLFGEGNLGEWFNVMRSNYDYAFGLTQRDFKILLCKVNIFGAPSLFIKADFFRRMNGYDESIHMLEDWPFWVRAAFNGAEFGYLETSEVDYRISEYSLSQGLGNGNNRYKEALRLVEEKNLHYMKKISWLYWIEGFLAFNNRYNNTLFWHVLSCLRPFNPFFWKVRRLYKNYINWQ